MSCCSQCVGIEKLFDKKNAEKDLKRYKKKGPRKNTRLLLEAIKKHKIEGSLLDIGGGVGIIQLELLKNGINRVTDIDASMGYIEVAKREAEKQGVSDKTTYFHGDFLTEASKVESHDLVTLDKVICCYPDMEQLVKLSVDKANKFYGLVYPKEKWWTNFLLYLGNIYMRIFRREFRVFIHPNRDVRAIIENKFKEVHYSTTGFWQIVLFERK